MPRAMNSEPLAPAQAGEGEIPRGARECRICWYVYDPQQGDPVWQVPPGTAFSALPGHWRCPNCDASPEQFMAVGDDR